MMFLVFLIAVCVCAGVAGGGGVLGGLVCGAAMTLFAAVVIVLDGRL